MQRVFGQMFSKKVWLSLLIVAPVCFLNPPAFADCSGTGLPPNDSPSTCSYVPIGKTVVVQPERILPFKPNDQTPTCEFVTNASCSSEVMVPYGTETEWQSFVANHEACVSLATCPNMQVALTATPSTILEGKSATLSWSITGGYGVLTCAGTSTDNPSTWPYPASYSYVASTSAQTGSVNVFPAPPNNGGSTTYTLTCRDSLQSSGSGSATIAIDQPLTVSLSAAPTAVIYGNSVNLTYNIVDKSGLSFTCTADNTDGDTVWVTQSAFSSGKASLSGGPVTVTPDPTGFQTSVGYSLTCDDGLNNSTGSVTVPVSKPSYTYVGGGYPACPSACNSSASTLYPTTCVQSPGGASVDLSYCAGQSQACPAAAGCGSGPSGCNSQTIGPKQNGLSGCGGPYYVSAPIPLPNPSEFLGGLTPWLSYVCQSGGTGTNGVFNESTNPIVPYGNNVVLLDSRCQQPGNPMYSCEPNGTWKYQGTLGNGSTLWAYPWPGPCSN